jgi:hypothetical protein
MGHVARHDRRSHRAAKKTCQEDRCQGFRQPNTLKVEIFGDTVIEGKLAGTVHGPKSTWGLIENGDELEVFLSSTTSTPWRLLFDSPGPVPVVATVF